MKNILLIASLLLICNYGYSQTKSSHPQPIEMLSSDCYIEWYTTFEKYGVEAIKDTTHEIIIAVCKETKCACYLGKVDVSGGEIVRYTLYIQQQDGSYVKPDRTLSPKYTNSEAKLEKYINNGMSPAYLTSQDETVYLLFYKSLKKVPRQQKKAPTPEQLNFK